MASVASQLIAEVTAHTQSDSLEDAREIQADGTYFPNTLRILARTVQLQQCLYQGMDDRRLEEEWFGSRREQRSFCALQLIGRHWDLIVLLFIRRCLSAVWKNLLKFYSGQNSLPCFLLKTGVEYFPDYLSAKLHDDATCRISNVNICRPNCKIKKSTIILETSVSPHATNRLSLDGFS